MDLLSVSSKFFTQRRVSKAPSIGGYLSRWFRRSVALRVHGYGESRIGPRSRINADIAFADNQIGLYVVADGFGQGDSGRAAASLGTETLREHLLAHLHRDVHQNTSELAHRVLLHSLETAKRKVDDLRQRSDDKSFGASLTAMLFTDRDLHFVSVGNTRGYLIRDGRMRQLTSDDTISADLRRAGQKSISEVNCKLLTRHLGDGQSYMPRCGNQRLQRGDRYLILSDGVYASKAPFHPQTQCAACDAADACRRLLQAATTAGTPDDAAAMVVDVHAISKSPEQIRATETVLSAVNFN